MESEVVDGDLEEFIQDGGESEVPVVDGDLEDNQDEDVATEELQIDEEDSPLETPTTERKERLTQLPLSRVKHIMKVDPEVILASQDVVFLISKATELFIQLLAKQSHLITSKSKKKTIMKPHVESAVSKDEYFMFLEGAIE